MYRRTVPPINTCSIINKIDQENFNTKKFSNMPQQCPIAITDICSRKF